METRVTALLPRGPETAVLPPYETRHHPSFVNALPRVIAERRPETTCGACETIEHAISIGLHVADYVDLQWRHVRAQHGGAR